jgi:DNA-binding Xre family transcriptional regulator
MKINVSKLDIAQAEKCFSNKELCEKAKISLVTLVQIKANKRNCLPITVGKIAKALNIPVSELVENE